MKQIGRYEVQEELGRGSMGIVYRAFDPRVGREIALKTHHLPEGLSEEEKQEYKDRFLREAQAAGVLSHPAIVTVHDADEDPGGVPYIAMEYIAGRSLKEILSIEGTLQVERVFEMAETLAGALHEAHAAGVVHRDIKPANIMVREQDGAFKLTDFGVARFNSSELTRSGLALGSPAYMSPEQISGRRVDGRSDLFSLAVVIYLALSGKQPFVGGDLTALAYAVVHETPVPLSRLAAGLPVGLDGFMDRALAKNPEDRFPDAHAFGDAMARLRTGSCNATSEDTERSDATRIDAGRVSVAAAPGWRASLLAALSARPRMIAGGLFLACLLLAWTGWTQARQATVIIEGRNSFEDATLTLLVDGEERLTRDLVAERKSARVFGKKLFEYGKETFETRFDLPPGRHEMVARVLRGEDGRVFEDKVTVKLETGETARFELVARQGRGTTGVTLEAD